VKRMLAMPAVKDLITDIRTFCAAFRASTNSRAALRLLQKEDGVKQPKILIMDVLTRWWSTYSMIVRLLEMHAYVVRDEHITDLELGARHYMLCRLLKHLLKPFRDFQVFMEGEKYVATIFY
jgi:hypothetical protein